jgi:uncharacterized protein (TIGR02246 family)
MDDRAGEIARRVMEAWLETGNRRDAGALAALFSHDGVCITRVGTCLRGRQAIQVGHERTYGRVTLIGRDFSVTDARHVGDSVIVACWSGMVAISGAGYAVDQPSVYGTVLRRQDDEWLLQFVQCTSVVDERR